MPHPVFFHIGAPKTGTTYLQDLLWRNREALRAHGTLFPGKGPGAHVMAAFDLRDITFKGYRNPAVQHAWRNMVAEIEQWDGPAIIDHEIFSGAKIRQAERAMRTLDFAEVHLVYTARDMARQLPAAWQEWIRNRERETFAEWLELVHNPVDEPAHPGRLFWRLHDTPAVLKRWTTVLPPERVHVITVPPSGSDPDVLWQRFAGVLRLDPAAYDTSAGELRSSLAAPEAEVLRRLNEQIGGDDFPWKGYDRVVKDFLSFELAKRRGPAIELPADEHDWATAWAHESVDWIKSAGFDVVGDLDELIPTARKAGIDPDAVPADAQADAAIAGMAALVRRLERALRPPPGAAGGGGGGGANRGTAPARNDRARRPGERTQR